MIFDEAMRLIEAGAWVTRSCYSGKLSQGFIARRKSIPAEWLKVHDEFGDERHHEYFWIVIGVGGPGIDGPHCPEDIWCGASSGWYASDRDRGATDWRVFEFWGHEA